MCILVCLIAGGFAADNASITEVPGSGACRTTWHVSWVRISAFRRCSSSRQKTNISSLQALDETRAKTEAAAAAAMKAQKAVAGLEVGIPKADMEIKAQQQRAADLQERLAELRSNAQVPFSSSDLFLMCCRCPARQGCV